MPGTLFVVATPIGNLEDITTRALRVLREVAIIAAEDTRRTAQLLTRYGIQTPTTSLHEHNESAKSPSLIARLMRGDAIALVSDAGTPTVSDPGQRLIQQAVESGIRIESIPGPSAVIAALAASGFSSDTFRFMGFPPVRTKDRTEWLEKLASVPGTAVFFEAPHRIRRTLEEIQAKAGDRPIVLCRELTKAHEELVRGPISSALKALSIDKGEFTIVVDIGHSTDNGRPGVPGAAILAEELGHIIETTGLSKRQSISELAKKYGLPTNAVYRLIESGKNSGK
jgi:16S rRNA (cytidine1402-2'-O)-methyltransferase